MEEQAEDSIIYGADYLIEPKEEMLDDTEKHHIPSTEELSNSSPHWTVHIDWTDLDQQTVKLKPIKTETNLCRDFAELQKAHQSPKDREECYTDVSTGYPRTQIKQEPSETVADLPGNGAQKLGVPSSSKCTMSKYKRGHQTSKNCTNQNTASTVNTVNQSSHYDYTINVKSKKHMVTHADYKKSHCCNICQIKIAQKHLTTHMRTHTGEKTFSCEHCDYISSNSTLLKYHIRTHTGEKPHYCNICHSKFARKHHLTSHMRIHTGEKTYSCEHCDYRSSNSSLLKNHIRTHTGEKPYFCEHCDYRSSHPTHLKNHLKTHTGEKPHSCNICHTRFALKHHLTTHMRTHTGEKPYSCEYCDYRSSNSALLKIHIRTHTGEKPHLCNICHTKFAQKRQLTTHMKTHTGEKCCLTGLPVKCSNKS